MAKCKPRTTKGPKLLVEGGLECDCVSIIKEIDEKYPEEEWVLGASCEEWRRKRSVIRVHRPVVKETRGDGFYGCYCPCCNRIICAVCDY